MRIAIRHRTHYAYASPAKAVMQLLRLTPRNHDGQTVKRWRIDLNCDGTLKAGEDPFGNLTHTLALNGPISDLEVTVEGERRILGPGDAYYFESWRPHRFRCVGPVACEVVSACTPPTF